MVKQRNILRQITDIQAQAKRLIKTKAPLIEIEQFADYSNEIKSFLIKTLIMISCLIM
ncbi:hypothetical protein GCM10011444_14470 [Winogradskyella haliclonae]|uniref:Uncharacterized protein n=1 Tax=Winogradskyella haliclonae TaxID=2048558 RepID=A0ABQ2C048_9FLAO|nr:hypothetical protein GCM10011444_14470 [Winogradskyella haliclonae]